MSPAAPPRIRLLDDSEEPGRTTANLLASLTARLASLHFVSGSSAVASMVAGFSALGREVSCTAEGARLRRALEATRVSTNGETLWSVLHLEEWASGAPPSPVLDHVRNDLALLLADDLEATLELVPVPAGPGERSRDDDRPATFLDCIVGLWAYGRELTRAVEAAARRSAPSGEADVDEPEWVPEPEGSMLR